ncbi:MAG: prepilin-type N-terminal cleavage/methylation domain-containing protein [Firmicutes bacterium]|nr:prepilin-type N-terminal cleavage/methylation domain-containing protein [Bacillota bacterium]MBQ3198974.1 prepilin-type N-terminal cleavage/methylation domain-containing protein [Bacillota bacterium]
MTIRQNRKLNTAGFSLVEVLVTIAILGMITVPVTSSLLVAHRLSVHSDELLQDRLAVSSTVEALMSTGITDEYAADHQAHDNNPDGVVVQKESDEAAYKVTVTKGKVMVATYIRPSTALVNVSEGGPADET